MESVSSMPPKRCPSYPEIATNAAHILVGVACALLDRQIKAQAAAFENEGGFIEYAPRAETDKPSMLDTLDPSPFPRYRIRAAAAGIVWLYRRPAWPTPRTPP